MEFLDVDQSRDLLRRLGIGLQFPEEATLYFFCVKEEGRVRAGELLGVLKRIAFDDMGN